MLLNSALKKVRIVSVAITALSIVFCVWVLFRNGFSLDCDIALILVLCGFVLAIVFAFLSWFITVIIKNNV